MVATRPVRIAIDGRKIADFGIGTYIRGLLNGLSAIDDPRLEYLVFAPPGSTDLIPTGPQFTHIEDESPHYSIGELFSVGRLAARHRADLFHAPHYVVPFTRLPVVTTIHDLIHLRLPAAQLPPGGRLYARWMIGRAVRKSKAVVTPSAAVRDEIVTRFGREREKVRAIPLGVDPELYHPDDDEAPPLGLGRHRYLLFVGNDKPHKNLDRLVEAFLRTKRTNDPLTLVIVGTKVERHAGEGIVNPGFIDEPTLASLYRHAIALVLPSQFEGFGLPVLEAMASGTATVISDIPSLRELAGPAAVSVDPGSVDEIERVIRLLAEQDDSRQRLGAAGLKRSAAYRWSECARATVAVYLAAASR